MKYVRKNRYEHFTDLFHLSKKSLPAVLVFLLVVIIPFTVFSVRFQQIFFGHAATPSPIKTVFIILMENTNWSQIKGNASAPYINNALLTQGAHAEQYYNPQGLHPSEPNY